LWQEHTQEKHIRKVDLGLARLQEGLLLRGGIAAYIPIIVVTICMFCGTFWLMPATDPARYQCYALTFWLGSNAVNLLPHAQCAFLGAVTTQPALHILPIEYPPLSLVPFSLALLVPLAYFQFAFALLMSFISVVIYWSLLRYGPRGAALIFALYIFIGAIAVAQIRYDLLPALLTLLCVIAAERKRWTAAYIALAFGVLLKLYPLLILPALFIAEQQARECFYVPPRSLTLAALPRHIWSTLCGVTRWYWKNCFIFLIILLGVTGIFALFNFQGAVVSQLSYFVQRPIQVEATGSTLLWIANRLGVSWQIVYTFGSLNIISGLANVVTRAETLLFGLGCLYVVWLQWRKQVDITQAAIALLLLFITTGKVFSPQYLIWLIPLLAYAGYCDTFWLLFWGAISLLTTFIYIFLYSRLAEPQQIESLHGFFETVGVRNLFLVLLTLAYLLNWFQARARRPLPPGPRETIS